MASYERGDEQRSSRSPAENTVSGTVGGSSVQAGAIYGGVHLHPTRPDVVVPRQLVAAPPHFTDRAPEIGCLERVADEKLERSATCVVVISGPAGVGKSALAAHWCAGVVGRFPDGQLYANLGGADPEDALLPGGVLGGFLRALGTPAELVPNGLAEQAGLFRSMTAERSVLVVLDNALSVAQVRPLLPSSPRSTVVVTSRWRLGGLVAEGAYFLELAALRQVHAVELLTRAVGSERAEVERESVTTLAMLCGRLPIALCVAGARLASRPRWRVSKVVAELADEQHRLTRLYAGGEPSVQATFDLSYGALSPEAARLYRLLSLHPGADFEVSIAGAVLDASTSDAEEVLDELVEANLVQEYGEDWFRFHDLVRLHARTRSEQDDDDTARAACVRRVLVWYLRAAARADVVVLPQRVRFGDVFQTVRDEPPAFQSASHAMQWLESHRGHIVGAARLAADWHFDVLCWQLCEALWGLFLHHKHFPDWLATHQLGITAARRCGDVRAQIRMRCQLGMAFLDMEQFEDASEYVTPALTLARDSADRFSEATVLEHLGLIARGQRRFSEAAGYLTEAIRIDEEAGTTRGRALHQADLGEILLEVGDHAAAVRHLQEARQTFAEVGDPYNEAYAKSSLGQACMRAGELASARTCYGEALQAMRELGSRFQEARILTEIARIDEQLGDTASAGDALAEALTIYTSLGSPEAATVQQRLRNLHRGGPQPGSHQAGP